MLWLVQGLAGDERIDIVIDGELTPQRNAKLTIARADGTTQTMLTLRTNTAIETGCYKHSGILPFVLQQLLAA